MVQYIIKRLLLLPLLLFIFSVIAFTLIQAPPGDFITSYIAELAASGSTMEKAQIDALRAQYGLDQPMYIQYFKWMGNILQGNLGVSLDWRKSNAELISERLVLTLLLGIFTFIISWSIAIPIGIYSATHQYSFLDYFFTVFNYIGVSIPSFMTALILMWVAFKYFGASVTGLHHAEHPAHPSGEIRSPAHRARRRGGCGARHGWRVIEIDKMGLKGNGAVLVHGRPIFS